MDLKDLFKGESGLSQAHRPIRLRLPQAQQALDDFLLVKRATGRETVCGGLEYRLFCVSTRAGLALKTFIALPVELQFVTDQGALRAVYQSVRISSRAGRRNIRKDVRVPRQGAGFSPNDRQYLSSQQLCALWR